VIAVHIKTILREAALFAAIRSHFNVLPRGLFRLYIADDGPISPRKEDLYEQLTAAHHVVARLPFDCGAPQSRNHLVTLLGHERFVLRADDDFELYEESNIPGLMRVMDTDHRIGALAGIERQVGRGKGTYSGEISDQQGFLTREGDCLIKQPHPLGAFGYRVVHGLRYAECHYSRNLLLIRRAVFDNVRWDERLRFEQEHEDFMLQLLFQGWVLALSPDSVHRHREDLLDEASDYEVVRGRVQGKDIAQVEELFMTKWGIRSIRTKKSLRIRAARMLKHIRHGGVRTYLYGRLREPTQRDVRLRNTGSR
jgi:hypothetical protein